MDNLKTIKQYAAHAGVSVQAVYRRLQTEQNARALDGHIVKDHGSTYLDEYAVQYLDGTRPAAVVGSPAAQQEQMVRELSDKAHKLQEENDALKEKLMDALQRLTAATKDAADSKIALADSQARLRLLEAQGEATGELLQEHKEQIRQKAEEADRLREDLDQARSEVHQLRLDTVEMEQLRLDLREAENEAEGFRGKYQEAQQERQDLQDDLQDAEEAIQQLREDLQGAEGEVVSISQKYNAARDSEAKTRQALGELQADLDAATAELSRLKNRGLWARIFNR